MTLEATGAHRRRGTALEAALLEAAWQELVEKGYAALTIESVAQRAGTSRAVLYRRWTTKAELVRAAVLHTTTRDSVETPDTGNLRDDMIAVLRLSNERRVGTSALLTYYLGAYFQETGTNFRDLRRDVIGSQVSPVDVVIDRAIARGEIDALRVTPRRRTIAFDLLRHEALMTLAPLPDAVIEEIVDDIFMPLIAGETDPGTRGGT
ncbi:MAG: TetR/AcrR family transcriptional regulator [Candidatus Nanopelagicales bacterium]